MGARVSSKDFYLARVCEGTVENPKGIIVYQLDNPSMEVVDLVLIQGNQCWTGVAVISTACERMFIDMESVGEYRIGQKLSIPAFGKIN